eukprot:snap_masked-scaffold_28-processed-gene-4.58-mRNA-1 protein AED:1.00 eAED:1.00 QI:0/0/0/0/1/1/2/0/108
MMKSIKKQYEERDDKTSFNIEWYIKDFYDDKAPNTKDMFKREIEDSLRLSSKFNKSALRRFKNLAGFLYSSLKITSCKFQKFLFPYVLTVNKNYCIYIKVVGIASIIR